MKEHLAGKMMFGLLLIAAGVIFMLDQLGYVSVDIGSLFSTYWPLFIIFWGVNSLVWNWHHRHNWSGPTVWAGITIAIGIYFLLRNLQFAGFENISLFKIIVPVALILFGLSMIFRNSSKQQHKESFDTYYGPGETRGAGGGMDGADGGGGQRSDGIQGNDPFQKPFPSGTTGQYSPGTFGPYDSEARRKVQEEWDRKYRVEGLDEHLTEQPENEPLHAVDRDDRPISSAEESSVHSEARDRYRDPVFSDRFSQENNQGASFGGQERKDDLHGQKEQWKEDLHRQKQQWKDNWKQQKEQWKAEWKGNKEQWKGNKEQWKQSYNAHSYSGYDEINRSTFIGDTHIGQDYWELKPLNVSHFIVDTVIDLTKARIPYGETKLNVSAFIGDVKLFVPNDMQVEVAVVASAFIGEMNVLDRREGGMFRHMKASSGFYEEAEKKIHITVSMFIGDVFVKRVG